MAFIGGFRLGTGLVLARLPDGSWSAPCAVGSCGITFGAVVGAEISDSVTALNLMAVEHICDESTTKLAVGGVASFAFGPLGRAAQAEALVGSNASVTSSTAYSHSRGLYGGVTLEGAWVSVRADVNHSFYGVPTSAADLLQGHVPQPEAAKPLYIQLDAYYKQAHQFFQQIPPRSPSSLSPSVFLCGPLPKPDESPTYCHDTPTSECSENNTVDTNPFCTRDARSAQSKSTVRGKTGFFTSTY